MISILKQKAFRGEFKWRGYSQDIESTQRRNINYRHYGGRTFGRSRNARISDAAVKNGISLSNKNN